MPSREKVRHACKVCADACCIADAPCETFMSARSRRNVNATGAHGINATANYACGGMWHALRTHLGSMGCPFSFDCVAARVGIASDVLKQPTTAWICST